MQAPDRTSDKDRPAAGSVQALRRRAEEAVRENETPSSKSLQALSPDDMRQTLHELQVHQIELEMQNEELRQAQLELDAARARYFDLYDLAPVGYCTVSEPGLILEANFAAATLLGMGRGRLVGQRFSRFIVKSQQDRFYLYRNQILASDEPRRCEIQMVKSDGTPVWVALQATAENDTNGVCVLRVVMSDVTERRQAELEREFLDQALLDKNADLERAMIVADKANHAKSEFLSSMSHELRTPLNAILGFAQLLESGTPAPTPSQQRSVDQILQAGWYLLALINEILDLALVDSGKLSLAPEPLLLGPVIQECRTMIEPQAQQRHIALNFPALGMPYTVRADRLRMKQILVNLLSNAIKYNRAGGSVDVKCTEISPGHIRIYVEDTGEGLSQEKIRHLFEPFNRLGRDALTEEGTGIGLVMAKRLVELMGGTMGADSTVGKGSTFWIEMDLTGAQPVSQATAPTRAPVQTRANAPLRTLLYVEDNRANLTLVEILLERRPDMRLLSARDGHSGVEMARSALPDVIVMDINLPDISGIEALKILRKDRATAHIPVLALSADAMPGHLREGLDAGFFRYLTKPIRIDALMATLDDALELAKTQSVRAANEGQLP